MVRLIIDEKGMPQNVTVISSVTQRLPATQRQAGLEMDESAVNAVKKFRFKPAMLNGHAVPVEVNVEQNFHVRY